MTVYRMNMKFYKRFPQEIATVLRVRLLMDADIGLQRQLMIGYLIKPKWKSAKPFMIYKKNNIAELFTSASLLA